LSLQRTPRLLALAAAGLACLGTEAFAIVQHGWGAPWLTTLLGPGPTQPAHGWGAVLYAAGCTILLAVALARQGLCNGDVFVVGTLLAVVGLTALFVFYPVARILLSALRDNAGAFAPELFGQKLFSALIWGIGCVTGEGTCGVAWHTVTLAVLVGLLTTLLGLAFALVANRTNLPLKPLLRALAILPVITPPLRHRPGANPSVWPCRCGNDMALPHVRHSV
jgi:iron(III) transport system permease protein